MAATQPVNSEAQPVPQPIKEPGFFEGMWLAFKIRLSNLFNDPQKTVDEVFKRAREEQSPGCVNWLREKHLKLMMVQIDAQIEEANELTEDAKQQAQTLTKMRDLINEKLGIASGEEVMAKELLEQELPLTSIKVFKNFDENRQLEFHDEIDRCRQYFQGYSLSQLENTVPGDYYDLYLERLFFLALRQNSTHDAECQKFYKEHKETFENWDKQFTAVDEKMKTQEAAPDAVREVVESCLLLHDFAMAYRSQAHANEASKGKPITLADAALNKDALLEEMPEDLDSLHSKPTTLTAAMDKKALEASVRAFNFLDRFPFSSLGAQFDKKQYTGDTQDVLTKRSEFQKEATEICNLLKSKQEVENFQWNVGVIWGNFGTGEKFDWSKGQPQV